MVNPPFPSEAGRLAAIADELHRIGDRIGRDRIAAAAAPDTDALRVAAERARDLVANYLWNEDDSGDETDLEAAHDLLVAVVGPGSEQSVGETLAALAPKPGFAGDFQARFRAALATVSPGVMWWRPADSTDLIEVVPLSAVRQALDLCKPEPCAVVGCPWPGEHQHHANGNVSGTVDL